jgi:ATP-dependent DNA helicase PIF1
VSKGSRVVIVFAAFSRSILWHEVRVLTLTKNMRLCIDPLSRPYTKYLLKVSNGQKSSIIDHFPLEANVEPLVEVEIALYLEIHQVPSLDAFIHDVLPTLTIKYANQGYMDDRAILTTKNIIVNFLNTQIAEAVLERDHVFLSTDSVETGDNQAMVISTKFLNTITLASMPPHRLALKVGIPVILLRNLDVALRLCNGTCLIIWRLARRLIVAQIIGGVHAGNIVNIPRITTTTNLLKWPFTLQRHQFPLQLAFAMTINKAQGQTMKTASIYLLEPVFTHGQLYVALSRTTSVNDVSVFCLNGKTTTNVVYMKLLQ